MKWSNVQYSPKISLFNSEYICSYNYNFKGHICNFTKHMNVNIIRFNFRDVNEICRRNKCGKNADWKLRYRVRFFLWLQDKELWGLETDRFHLFSRTRMIRRLRKVIIGLVCGSTELGFALPRNICFEFGRETK